MASSTPPPENPHPTSDTLLLLPPPASPHPPSYDSTTPLARTTTSPPHTSVRSTITPSLPHRRASTSTTATELPGYTPTAGNSYKGYPTQEEYLAALKAWAEEKGMMVPADKSRLMGFYGSETMEDCVRKNPALRLGLRGKRRRKEMMEEGGVGAGVGVGGGSGQEGDGGSPGGARERSKSGIGQWLRRKSAA